MTQKNVFGLQFNVVVLGTVLLQPLDKRKELENMCSYFQREWRHIPIGERQGKKEKGGRRGSNECRD